SDGTAAQLNGAAAQPAGTHTVVSGDTLWDIAAANGISLQSLIEANPQIRNPDLIYPDQIVHLPGGSRDGGTGAAPGAGAGGDARLDTGGLPPAANDRDPATLRPYTVYSTGHQGAIAIDSAADQQPHHD